MITKFITEVKTVFNPFSPKAKSARIFLSFLPSNARQMGMKIDTKLLPRASKAPSTVELKFSECASNCEEMALICFAEDGKELKLDPEVLGLKGLMDEVDRHSRGLLRQEELGGN